MDICDFSPASFLVLHSSLTLLIVGDLSMPMKDPDLVWPEDSHMTEDESEFLSLELSRVPH